MAEVQRLLDADLLDRLKKDVSALGGKVTEAEGHRIVVEHGEESAAPALIQLLLQRLPVVDINLEKTDIETIVTRIYRPFESESRPS